MEFNRRGTILVLKNLKTGETYPLSKRLIIGRRRGHVLFQEDKMMSGVHARLQISGDNQLALMDLNSSNGVILEDKRIPANQPIFITTGQRFQVGSQELVVHEEPYESWLFVSPMQKHYFLTMTAGYSAVMILLPFVNATFRHFMLSSPPASVILYFFSFLVPTLLITYVLSRLMLSFPNSSSRLSAAAGGFVLASLLQAAFIYNFSAGHQMVSSIKQSKIEYHCLENFVATPCVQSILDCPACAKTLDRWKRQKIQSQLSGSTNNRDRTPSNK